MRRLLLAAGTRPEYVKIAPVARALADRGLGLHVVATGQHWDHAMAGQIQADLGLHIDEEWDLGDTAGAERIGALMANAYAAVPRVAPDAVVVLGDTVTVPLFALAARGATVPLVHLEAGLRSYNPQSVEEVNRQVAGALASLHLAPTSRAREVLLGQGVPGERIVVTGNPAIDAIREVGPAPTPLSQRHGVVMTAHRPTNVDVSERLRELVSIAESLAHRYGSVAFPVHPRTRQRLIEEHLLDNLDGTAGVELLPPVPYRRMLDLVSKSRLVVTDSGGLQEEAAWYGVPALVLRQSTPRWEGIELDIARLCGVDRDGVLTAAAAMLDPEAAERIAGTPCPYGDGHAAERIADCLADEATWSLLRLDEPDYRDAPVPSP